MDGIMLILKRIMQEYASLISRTAYILTVSMPKDILFGMLHFK